MADEYRSDVMDGDEIEGATAAGANGPAAQVPDEMVITPEDITTELDNLRRDVQQTNDRYLRLAAEFDNYRKRVERERTDAYARAQADVVRRVVDVVDDLERVAQFDQATPVAALLEGVRLVEKKLQGLLESLGLESVDAAGAIFDPATMEAIATTPAEHPEEDDVVHDVFQRGYRFKGQLLRPARVRVKKYEG